jgi:5-formyltetrahydrofolate cyclo-ligase
VHELQVRAAGTIPLTGHDVPVDFIVTPDRVIDCRRGQGARPAPSIRWEDLTDEKVAAIPPPASPCLFTAQRPGPE